jgi:pyridoxamine 5'-phosphate oxidase
MKSFAGKQFEIDELDRSNLEENPYMQFDKWYKEASASGIEEPNSMSLATATSSGFPSVRTVYLKYFDDRGFVFFTNYTSQKAFEIEENPNVEILFYWMAMERQIRVKGKCEKVSKLESLKYFASRPRDSQLGAWCSNQSSTISSRSILIQKFDEMKRKFENGEVPIPDSWGGYRIIPEKFEFWQGRKSRLHDRFQYQKSEGIELWNIVRLAP